MLYIALALTVFRDWTQANPTLADGILFALAGLTVLSWVVADVRKLCDLIELSRENRMAAELFACRIPQARAGGETVISPEGLWR